MLERVREKECGLCTKMHLLRQFKTLICWIYGIWFENAQITCGIMGICFETFNGFVTC